MAEEKNKAADEAEKESSGYRWRNWSRELRCEPQLIARPHTREGMVSAIVAASEEGRTVKVAGSGHSFTPAALTDGTMLRIESLSRVLEVDRVGGRVKVEAGIMLGDLNRRLDKHGVALENLGDIDRQTLGGAISTATHGTGARLGNISSQIEAMEVVGADGTLHELSEASDPDAFRAARVGIGALGAIYSVTLRTVPAFRIDRTDRNRPLDEVIAGMDTFANDLDHFEFYVFPHTSTALCRESTRTDAAPKPPNPIAAYAQEVMFENWVAGAFAGVSRFVPAATPTLTRMAAAGAGTSRTLDHSFRVFASERRIKFTEMEYCVPRANAREAVEGVLEIANRPELGVAFPIEVRFVAGDDALPQPLPRAGLLLRGRPLRPPRRSRAVLRRRRGPHGAVRRPAPLGQAPHARRRRPPRPLPALRRLPRGARPARSGRRLRQRVHRPRAGTGRGAGREEGQAEEVLGPKGVRPFRPPRGVRPFRQNATP